MRFSQRKGLKSVREMVQKDSIDDALRNGLWNVLDTDLWGMLEYNSIDPLLRNSNLNLLFRQYWGGYFNWPLDTLPVYFKLACQEVRKYFFGCQWFEVYDFIEFTAQSAPDEFVVDFVTDCNYVLKHEVSAYRFIDKQIVEITSEEEISSVEAALRNTQKLKGVHMHLEAALSRLSDRKSPNSEKFRTSIKESISAVEALAQVLTGDPKATLGTALKTLEKKSHMHPALKSSLSSLYGYTSDEQGIRHAMLDEPELTANDAKFMLVACTAFVNYLVANATDQGIKVR